MLPPLKPQGVRETVYLLHPFSPLPDPKVLPGTRRVLGFSPVIIDRHVSRYLLAFLADDFRGL